MLRVALLLPTVLSLRLVTLNDLWPTKYLPGYHLFPTHESSLYPRFLSIPTNGSSSIHLTPAAVITFSRSRLLHSVCAYRYVNTTYFIANEVQGIGSTELGLGLSLEGLQFKANQMTAKLVKPSYFCYDPHSGRFSGVWQRSIEPLDHFEIHLRPIREMAQAEYQMGMNGYFSDCWQAFDDNGTAVALAIWRKGFGVRYRVQFGHSLEELEAGMNGTDMHPVALNVVPKTKPKGKAIWWLLWQGREFTWKDIIIHKTQTKSQEWAELDRLVVTQVDENAEMRRVGLQMRQYDVPSISVCVMNRGRQLYEAAYGFSDVRREKQATPFSEYRIASISKTVTAMGIVKLIKTRRLSLDTLVFGEKGLLWQYPVHSSLTEIRIRHLLEHASGGWSHFQRQEFNRNESDHITFVKRLLSGYQIKKSPGEVFTYSNIGYMFLGRVIEQITGVPYETFIQSQLLLPLNISARIGDKEPGPHEVTYYSQDNASPYNHWNPRLLDAATGWVFNACELAKLFAELERGRRSLYSDIAEHSNATWTYGRGIQLGSDGSLFHTGSLAGSESFATTRGGQVVILSNLRGRHHNVHTGWMQVISKRVLDGVSRVRRQ